MDKFDVKYSRAFYNEAAYSNESLRKRKAPVYPQQPHPINGFPKGPRPFGRRRHIRLLEIHPGNDAATAALKGGGRTEAATIDRHRIRERDCEAAVARIQGDGSGMLT